ncbi:MAG: rRNA maturation RNase YbeY [Opitutales bacterium]|nr:rRNA maturation RNase YbeY [Opitutales bacterium]
MIVQDEIINSCKGFKILKPEIRSVLKTLRRELPWAFPRGILSIAFVDDDRCCELHEKFLNDPSKTDVITFPGDEVFDVPVRLPSGRARGRIEEDFFAGEIVICVDQAQRAALQYGTTPEDEILLYLVHGFLHLAGIDDLEEADRKLMRSCEKEAIEILRSRNIAPLKTLRFPKK